MNLQGGFVVGGRYRVVRPWLRGEGWDAAVAESDADGPGEVVIFTAAYAPGADLDAWREHRARFEAWVSDLAESTSVARIPGPLLVEQVRMYPGDPEVRARMRVDAELRSSEPYAVFVVHSTQALVDVARRDNGDDDWSLSGVLQLLRLAQPRAGGSSAVRLADLRYQPVTGAVSLLPAEVRWSSPPEPERRAAVAHAVATLLGRMPAPPWTAAEPWESWRSWLARRRVPPEQQRLVETLLQTDEGDGSLEAALDAASDRVRGLLQRPLLSARSQSSREPGGALPLQTGDRWCEHWRVVRVLAQGGRGVLYQVSHDDEPVQGILKLNRYAYDSASEFAAELDSRRQEIRHEGEVLRRFGSRAGGIPRLIARGVEEGRGAWFDLAPELAPGEPGVVMEPMPGIPLLDLLQFPREGYNGLQRADNRLPTGFVVSLMAQLARLLAVFHDEGYLFQDLKTENLLYDPANDRLSLVDLAAACPRDAQGLLRRDSVAFGMQTHGFAAPEFGQLWEKTDHRFDLYSLGATAWHLLTGMNPERIALDRNEEYPQLPVAVLTHCPPEVQALVARCLAPVDQRWPDARTLADAADRTLLVLSRSRPLDVRDPVAGYLPQGVRLSWQPPADPRISGIRIVRRDADGERELYQGPPRLYWDDPTPLSGRASWEVRTQLTRQGRIVQSRGRDIEAVANPPAALDVHANFGAIEVRVSAPPHAERVEVRWALGYPPATPDEGEALTAAPDADGVRLHRVDHTDVVFYAAFAHYDDPESGALTSAPTFASTAALPAPPELGPLHVQPQHDGLQVAWGRSWPGLAIRLVVQGGSPGERVRFYEPEPNATTLLVDDCAPDALVRVAIVVRQQGVVSAPQVEQTAQLWPAPPELQCLPMPGGVRLEQIAASSRIRGCQVRVGDAGEPLAWEGGEPLRLTVPEGEANVVVTAVLDDDTVGPTQVFAVQVPPARVAVVARTLDDIRPARLQVRVPAHVAWASTSGYRLVVEQGERQVGWRWTSTGPVLDGPLPDGVQVPEVEDEAPVSDLDTMVHDGAGAVVWIDALTAVGEPCRWQVRWLAPSGDVLGSALLEPVVRERLAPPELAATPDALTVLPVSEPIAVDVAWVALAAAPGVRAATDGIEWPADAAWTVEAGVMLPLALHPDAETWMAVRLRRSSARVQMPWSEPSVAVCPGVPVFGGPAQVELHDGLPRLRWAPVEGRAARYRVWATGGVERLVYDGNGLETLDFTPGAGAWRLVAERDGLSSAALELVLPDAASVSARSASEGSESATALVRSASGASESATALVRSGSSASGVSLRYRADHTWMAVQAHRQTLVEVCGPAQVRVLLARWIAPDAPATVPDRVWQAANPATHWTLGWAERMRALLLLPGPPSARHLLEVWVADPWNPDATWARAGAAQPVEPGAWVGALHVRTQRVQLVPTGAALDRNQGILVGLRDAELPFELPLRESEPLRMRGAHAGSCLVDIGVMPDTVQGLRLQGTTPPAILVPLREVGPPSAVARQAMLHTAFGLANWLVLHETRRVHGALVSVTLGPTATAHVLVEGRYRNIQVEALAVDSAGRVRVRVHHSGTGWASSGLWQAPLTAWWQQPDRELQRLQSRAEAWGREATA